MAVLPVLFYHAGFGWFPGGFVGVDVFFVISGYLITGILRDDLTAGRFSLLGFYERRVRRIVPALVTVCLATIPAAWFWLAPREFDIYGQTLIGVNVSFSNFLFWKRADYFAPAAELEPFLHTWSLGVEEQFYLLFPVLLLILRKRGRTVATVTVLCLASFAATQILASLSPPANFYLLPTRFWELGAGALLALTATGDQGRRTLFGDMLSLAGLALIVGSIVLIDSSRPFPGWWTVPVVAGTVMVLEWGRAGTPVARVLGWSPLAGIGLISYSAYLWHQPLLAFARIRLNGDLPRPLLFALIGVTLVLAYATWRWVERPFRDRARSSRRQILTSAVTVSGCLIAFGIVADLSGGLPLRHDDRGFAGSISERMRHNTGLGDTCVGQLPLAPTCETGDDPEILVWGDSFAMHIVPAILASKPDARLVQFTKPVCGPFLDLAPTFLPDYPRDWAQGCHAYGEAVKAYVSKAKSLRYAVLASPFGQYFGPGIELLSDGSFVAADDALVLAHLRRTLDWLVAQGITPVIVAPPPQDGLDTARCLVRAKWFGDSLDDCRISRAAADAFRPDVRALLAGIAKYYRVIDPADHLCDASWCKVEDGGTFIYRDAGHFSYEGAAYVGKGMGLYDLVTRPASPAS